MHPTAVKAADDLGCWLLQAKAIMRAARYVYIYVCSMPGVKAVQRPGGG